MSPSGSASPTPFAGSSLTSRMGAHSSLASPASSRDTGPGRASAAA
jgi:hypothetical protein